MNTGITKSDKLAKLIELIKAKKADREAAKDPHQKGNDNNIHKRESPEAKSSEEASDSSEPNQSKCFFFLSILHTSYTQYIMLFLFRKETRSSTD